MTDHPTYPHATDPPLWWCKGHFDPEPIRHIGAFHPALPPGGSPVYRCLDCGDELFHSVRSAEEENKIRRYAEEATA